MICRFISAKLICRIGKIICRLIFFNYVSFDIKRHKNTRVIFRWIPRTEDCCLTLRFTLAWGMSGGGSTWGPVYIPSNFATAVKTVTESPAEVLEGHPGSRR